MVTNSAGVKKSAGLLMYRLRRKHVEVLLVHLGGPFWAKKDRGAWVIPKGEIHPGEEPLAAAQREFEEETGIRPEGDFIPLGSVTHRGGKIVQAWAFAGDCDTSLLHSNTFSMEWPPRSGRQQEFPEVDRGEFFTVDGARDKINPAEFDLILRLDELLACK